MSLICICDFCFLFLVLFHHHFSPCTSGSVIFEENVDEFTTSSDQNIPNINGIRIGSSSGSLSLTIQSQQQQSYRTESPQSAYSPYGNSPVIDQSNHSGYMMMSPGTDYNKGYVGRKNHFSFPNANIFHSILTLIIRSQFEQNISGHEFVCTQSSVKLSWRLCWFVCTSSKWFTANGWRIHRHGTKSFAC